MSWKAAQNKNQTFGKMNKVISILLALLATLSLKGAEMPVERIYVSTDREVYIAGDMVWCSLFWVGYLPIALSHILS